MKAALCLLLMMGVIMAQELGNTTDMTITCSGTSVNFTDADTVTTFTFSGVEFYDYDWPPIYEAWWNTYHLWHIDPPDWPRLPVPQELQ